MENIGRAGLIRVGTAPDDDALLARRAKTEPEAFGLLYERHVSAVFRYLRARGADEDLAEELTAVAFERALRAIDRFVPGRAGFRPWLLTIARNAWIDSHRRTSRDAPFDPAMRMRSDDPTPEAAVLAAEERAFVMRLFSELPEGARDALALRYAGGLSMRQIAEVLGKSEEATKKIVSRSLASLREVAAHDR